MERQDLKDLLKASYMSQKKAAEYMDKRGYSYDPELSTMEQKVFINKETGNPLIAERGSKRVSDWLYEDPMMVLGLTNTRRVKESKNLSKETSKKYGIDPDIVGHSLGGYLAENAARDKSNVYTYNKAASIPQVFQQNPQNQYDYRTTLDIPSFLGQFQSGGTKQNISGSWNPIASHDIEYL